MPGSVAAVKAITSVGACAAALVGLSACGVVKHEPNLIAGKTAFVQKCGACHALNRAGTTGVAGPNLDQAFQRSIVDGFKRSSIEGVVLRQIGQPKRGPQMDPQTLKPTAAMPANLVEGSLASDVAAYVASAAAKPGGDAGRLADVGVKKSTATTQAKNGQVDIPVDPSGALAYQFAAATSPAGSVELISKNEGSTGHNIAVEGNGLDKKGPVVNPGGTSEVTADLKPGEYTFYCSVPGHREGGMVGKLTVK
jgi:uncharacterized cupredoxin-like copper-binding protein